MITNQFRDGGDCRSSQCRQINPDEWVLEQKISIVTPKPQTTRNRILGIMNDEEYQIVLLDTPGLHTAREPLNREMVRIAIDSLRGRCGALTDRCLAARAGKTKEERDRNLPAGWSRCACPVILVLNKVDLMDKEKLLAMIEVYTALFPFHAIIPMSALHGDGNAAAGRAAAGLAHRAALLS